jgi:molecular chaperone GrpE
VTDRPDPSDEEQTVGSESPEAPDAAGRAEGGDPAAPAGGGAAPPRGGPARDIDAELAALLGEQQAGQPDDQPAGAPAEQQDEDRESEEGEEVGGGTILTDVVALAQERDDYLGALQRLQADFENYRKRVQRQQEEQSARAAVDLVGKLLPVLDALDLAEAHLGAGTRTGSDDEAARTPEGEALSQSRAMLIDALAKEGLERVDKADVPFDPVVHDAVAHAPAEEGAPDGPPETVVEEVLRSGYRWRGRVLRPAMVRVRG